MLFRITARKHGGSARRYYSGERLALGDDIDFWGNLGEAFGRDLTWNDANRLFLGKDPDSGRQLVRLHKGVHKSGWDMTFVAPKSVSVLWGLAPEHIQDIVQAAHISAVKEALSAFSPKAVRNNASLGRLLTGGYLFHHGMTRLRDPHLHTHVFLLNLAYAEELRPAKNTEEPRSGFRTLSVDYRWARVARDLYLCSLAWNLVTQGVPVLRAETSFEIPGLEKLVKVFSQGKDLFEKQGLTPEEWQRYKQDKDLSRSFRRLQIEWVSRAIAVGFDPTPFFKAFLTTPVTKPGALSGSSVLLWKIRRVARIWSLVARSAIGTHSLDDVQKVATDLETEYRKILLERREAQEQGRLHVGN